MRDESHPSTLNRSLTIAGICTSPSSFGLMGSQSQLGKGVTQVAEFEIYKDQDNPQDFRWRLRANNGEIIADSGEGYIDKDDVEYAIELLKSQAATAQVRDMT
jgi:uncharacterized protein